MSRCGWSEENDLLRKYHDSEWGVPLHDDRRLFEFLVLDAFQAGLSWSIILKKRYGFRRAFDHFDPEKIARYGPKRIEKLLQEAAIIRNRMKIEATVENAKAFLEIQDQFGSFDSFIWQFVRGKPITHRYRYLKDLPTHTRESDKMSQVLKEQGFKFVGSTICYAFMQAAGMVNDHLTHCFRHSQICAGQAGAQRTRRGWRPHEG
ncbi:MAG: DNA-3-methyladenine glycosylase I [Acidobacteria bacterium]|nr:DNA-3-methyladenine glycosylase I [Acidobacteriota bacterium]